MFMVIRRSEVTVRLDSKFFDKVLDMNRKKMMKQLGLNNLTTMKFTKILAIKGAKLYFPNRKRRKSNVKKNKK